MEKNNEGYEKENQIIIDNGFIPSNNGLGEAENPGDKIDFNKDLANQEWINERDSIRYRVFGGSAMRATQAISSLSQDIMPFLTLHNHNDLYYVHQNKFEKFSPLGNRIFSIDTGFAKNMEYNHMFKQKYCIDVVKAREAFYMAETISITLTSYVLSHTKEKSLYHNKEIRKLTEDDINPDWMSNTDAGLDFENISLEDRKKFNGITNVFFDLPNTHMKSVAKFLIKHQSYSNMFFLQGIMHQMSLNVNTEDVQISEYTRDMDRNGVFPNDYNSRKQENLSYYSRHIILCFFRPEYLFSNEKPDSKLIEFYVALNSLLSTREKENAKAILNADDKKLTEQQKELKKKLSGENEDFRTNIINAWKDGFFLDKNKIKQLYNSSDDNGKTHNLFEDKEKEFEDYFNKINKDDLKSRCFIYYENKGFVKIIDWLIIEIENDNLKLVSQNQDNDLKDVLSNKKSNDEKIDFLVTQLFSGARIADKNMTYLKFSDEERNKYSKSDLQEKLKLIDNKIQFCPKAAKILKPSEHDFNTYSYKDNDEQKRDYIYLRENKNYYRDYILHKDYGENELYNKLYQYTQKADFGKYKREHFIFDETGKIIGMDVLAYFADEIVNGELKLKDNEGKDISDEVKNIDNDLAREVFLMNKLKDNACYVFDNENNKIELDENDKARISRIVEELQNTIKNSNTENGFIKMFRLEKEDVEKIVKDMRKGTNALMYRYALNQIFIDKINPLNSKNKQLIDNYVFDFSKINCKRDDLVFTKDGRVEYVKYESLPKVLNLDDDDIEKNEFKARNRFVGLYEKKERYKSEKTDIEISLYDVKISNGELSNKLKEKYKVSEENSKKAKCELEDLRRNLDDNECANLSDFYDLDSYRDEFLDKYIKFYQDAQIDYEYWATECAQKFLKDIKEKKEKNNDDIANIELQFFKGEVITHEDLSQYTKDNKHGAIKETIELKKFKNNKIWYRDLSQHTKDTKKDEITEIELELFKNNKIGYYDLSQHTKDTKKDEITEIECKLFENNQFYGLSLEKQNANQTKITEYEFGLLKENKLSYDDLSQVTQKNIELQQQKSRLHKLNDRLELNTSNTNDSNVLLNQLLIDGKSVFYNCQQCNNQELENGINVLKVKILDWYKSQNIPYKHWDSDTKEDYFDKLQWKCFKIGCIPLVLFILFFVSCFLQIIPIYLAVKIILTVVFFILGCLFAGKGIKNKKDRDYVGPNTYDHFDYNYPNDNSIEPPVNVVARQQNMNINIFKKNSKADLNTTIIDTSSPSNSTTSSSNNKQSKNDPEDTNINTDKNINTNSISSSSSGSSEQSHESDSKTADSQQDTDLKTLKINLESSPLTMVDPKDKTENDLRDKDKNIIEQEPGNP